MGTTTIGYDTLGNLTSKAGVSYSYGTTGNLTSKTGVGSYSYGSNGNGTGAGPHQARTVGGATYSYDANGNLQSGGGRTFTWTADNLPATVTPTPMPIPSIPLLGQSAQRQHERDQRELHRPAIGRDRPAGLSCAILRSYAGKVCERG